MGKIFFVRKTANDLLVEQNALLLKLLENQKTPIIVSAPPTAAVGPKGVAFSEEEMDEGPSLVDDTVHTFVPKIAKATKTDVGNVNTSAAAFDSDAVAKLKKAKEAAAKKG